MPRRRKLIADGLCYVEPIPFLAVLDEMRTIEIGKDEVVMHFDNSGDHVVAHDPYGRRSIRPTFNLRFTGTPSAGGKAIRS